MYRLHLTRNLRSLGFLLMVAAVLAGICVLWWANRTGLPDSWRDTIEREVAKHGAHITIGGLRYVPLEGILATDVRVYAEAEHIEELSRLERVILDFDKTKLARGIVNLNKIELLHARLALPVDPKNPSAGSLDISDANGTVFMPGDQRLEIREAHGKIAGIEFTLDARLVGYQQAGPKPPDDSYLAKRRAMLAKILSELEKWDFDKNKPPSVRISVEGDVNKPASLDATVSFHARHIGKKGHMLTEVTAEAELTGELLTVNTLHATDGSGALDGHIDCNLQSREGRFDLTSTLEIPPLLAAWLDISLPKNILLGGRQKLEAQGSFQLDENNSPQIRTTGHARCESVTLRGAPFQSVEGSFAWREQELFLRDVRLTRKDGAAEAKAMVEGPVMRLAVHSTLPVPVYQQLVAGLEIPIEKILGDFTEREGAAVDITAEGSLDFNNHLAWAYTGHGSAKNLNYRGVPVNAAQCQFTLNHDELDFHDGSVEFNYSKYALHKAFEGATVGTAKVGRIRFDAPHKLVEVDDVRGPMWAAPVVRLFAPKIADSLEQYRFHQPPELKASGIVDVTPQGRTTLDISFSSDHPADYLFLGESLTLDHPRGQVAIRGEKVTVANLRTAVFGGPVAGEIDYLGGGRLQGEINWTKLALPQLTSTYGFQMKGAGTTTGRLDFSLSDGKVETMEGKGLVALEQAELFSVPMFGPLSPLIVNVLNNDHAGYQSARNAFCTFTIHDGILSSNDFQTATKSLNFAGDGSVDLARRTLDMTMRLNARGLLGLITLPLRPFSGLFQFHGSGPLKETKWESKKFTQPTGSQRDMLLEPPRATVIGGGE